jgi:hypothetical protein
MTQGNAFGKHGTDSCMGKTKKTGTRGDITNALFLKIHVYTMSSVGQH